MAGYLLCIASESGIPLFARKVGDISPIEFPLAASLNGVRVFGKAHGVKLLTTMTQSTRSLWEDFYDRVSLIFLGTDDTPTDLHMKQLLENIFNVIVFHVGLEFILNTTSVEKFKRELRGCYPMIDKLLHGLRPSENTLYFSDLTKCNDVFLQIDINLQNLIDIFSGNIISTYICLSSRGIIITATKDWGNLKSDEIMFILFKAHEVNEPYIEINIYLPISGHKLPFRLLVFKMSETLRLTILCPQDPPFHLIKKEVKKLETKSNEIFQQIDELTNPMTTSYKYLHIEKAIAGFLIINTATHRCAFSISNNEFQTTSHLKIIQKLETLRVFYRNTVDSIFSMENKFHNKGDGIVKEAMWASEYHKCHAIRSFPYQLFVIYEIETSHGLMRLTSQRLLPELMKDRAMK